MASTVSDSETERKRIKGPTKAKIFEFNFDLDADNRKTEEQFSHRSKLDFRLKFDDEQGRVFVFLFVFHSGFELCRFALWPTNW